MPRGGGASSNHRPTGITGSSAFADDDEIELNERIVPRHQHHRDQAAGGSQRQLRVGELIRHELSAMLSRGDIHDPVVEAHMITVPEVRMSPDLRLATIYIMPLGGRDAEHVLEALDRNKKFVRGVISRRVNLKFAPEIRFRVDERFDEAERIEKLLRTPVVQRDLAHDESTREDDDE